MISHFICSNIIKSPFWIYTLLYVSLGIWAGRRLRAKLWYALTKGVQNAWGQGWCVLPCHRVQQASHTPRPAKGSHYHKTAKYSCTALSHSQQHCLHCPLLRSHFVCRKRLTLFIAVTAVYFYITSADKMEQSKNAKKTEGKQLSSPILRCFCPLTMWSPTENEDPCKSTHKLIFLKFSHLCST